MPLTKTFNCARCACSGVTVECCLRRQKRANARQTVQRQYPECADCPQGQGLIAAHTAAYKALSTKPPQRADYTAMHAARREAKNTFETKMDSMRLQILYYMEEI